MWIQASSVAYGLSVFVLIMFHTDRVHTLFIINCIVLPNLFFLSSYLLGSLKTFGYNFHKFIFLPDSV